MRITIVFILLAITGCASQPTLNKQFQDNIRIGVVYPEVNGCFEHNHTGHTAFNNFNRSYQNPFNWNKEIQKAFQVVTSNNGDTVIFIDNVNMQKPTGSIFNVNGWSGKYTVKPENEAMFQAIISNNDLDILVFSTTFGYGERASDCFTYDVETDARKREVAVLSPEYFLVVDAQNINSSVSTIGVYGEIVDGYYPENIQELSSSDLEIINKYIRRQLIDSVRLLYKQSGMGEKEFTPKTVPTYFYM
ncbi:hypothetical protein [Marinagarivorans algicola]|uniref:hypothetical protein n=1 Tax=Marinagarivorans algicola TaxID=1513270 RepID=UPI003736E679